MNWKSTATALSVAMLASTGLARADGELNIFNWGNYTSPELIKKFEETYKVKVSVTDYDSNDTALAKVRQGGHGFDIVVPSASVMNIWIKEGLLLESRPDQMENFKNMDPPKELVGKVNVVPEMADVMHLAISYVGGEPCTGDKEVLKKARDALVAAKPKWISIDYGNVDRYAKGDIAAGVNWNGASFRARLQNDKIVYGYPKEGYPVWMDNVSVLKDAKNVENAKLFLNFMMDPENAGMNSAFHRYANGIAGSDQFMPDDMKGAPEVEVPEELKSIAVPSQTCPPEVQELYTRIWTELQK